MVNLSELVKPATVRTERNGILAYGTVGVMAGGVLRKGKYMNVGGLDCIGWHPK